LIHKFKASRGHVTADQVIEAYSGSSKPKTSPTQTATTCDSLRKAPENIKIRNRSRNDSSSSLKGHKRHVSWEENSNRPRLDTSFGRRKAYDSLLKPILKQKAKKKPEVSLDDSEAEIISILVRSANNPEESNETPYFSCQESTPSRNSSTVSCFQERNFESEQKNTLNVPLMREFLEDYELASQMLDQMLQLAPNELKLSEKIRYLYFK